MTELEAAQVLQAIRAQNRDGKYRLGCDCPHSIVWGWCFGDFNFLVHLFHKMPCELNKQEEGLTPLLGSSCCSVGLTEDFVLCRGSCWSSPPHGIWVFKSFRGKKIHYLRQFYESLLIHPQSPSASPHVTCSKLSWQMPPLWVTAAGFQAGSLLPDTSCSHSQGCRNWRKINRKANLSFSLSLLTTSNVLLWWRAQELRHAPTPLETLWHFPCWVWERSKAQGTENIPDGWVKPLLPERRSLIPDSKRCSCEAWCLLKGIFCLVSGFWELTETCFLYSTSGTCEKVPPSCEKAKSLSAKTAPPARGTCGKDWCSPQCTQT